MFRKAIWALAALVALAVPAAVHAQGDYLDVGIVKVKPEKVAEFESIAKEIADANRRFNGDRWLAMQTMYGDGDVYIFVSTQDDYADIDGGSDAFLAALNKSFGKQDAEKLLHDFESCLVSSRSEIRRRRMDLSTKPPLDRGAYVKLIAGSRVIRYTVVRVRPGHVAEFEVLLAEVKAAAEKNANARISLVSRVVAGGQGGTFYLYRGSSERNGRLRQ